MTLPRTVMVEYPSENRREEWEPISLTDCGKLLVAKRGLATDVFSIGTGEAHNRHAFIVPGSRPALRRLASRRQATRGTR